DKLFARVGLVLRKRNPDGGWVGLLDQSFAGGGRVGRRGGGSAGATSTASGVRVPTLVSWGTPAYRAGIEEDDGITAADGKPNATIEDWQAAVRAHKPGDFMPVELSRHGSTSRTSIAVEADPTMEVVTLESTGGTLSADQKSMRDGWLSSKRK